MSIGTATSDSDGWYLIIYKHTGKATTYKVVLKYGDIIQTQDVVLKANSYQEANFNLTP